jgi:hypothetical protein
MFKRFVATLASLATALAATVLPGCDATRVDDLKPGVATAGDVRQRLGNPAAEYVNVDGSQTWEYNRQPNGVHTHMLTFGSDQVLLRIEQVLDDEHYAQVVAGMSQEQVQRLLGKPGSVASFPLKREEVWEWRIEGTPADDYWRFHAYFSSDSGLLVRAGKMRLPGRG